MLILALREHEVSIVNEVRMQPLSSFLDLNLDQDVWSIDLALPLDRGVIEAASTNSERFRAWEQREELVRCMRDNQRRRS